MSFGSAVENFEIIKSEIVCDSRKGKTNNCVVFLSFQVSVPNYLRSRGTVHTLPVLRITETFIMAYLEQIGRSHRVLS